MISQLKKMTFVPSRDLQGPFIFAVDHCFSIKGQGTIMTGTVLSGRVQVNSTVEIATLKEVRKVKSIQIFREPTSEACQGDRAGICVTQFDSSLLERGLVSSPGLLPTALAMIIHLNKIRYYKGDIVSGAKFHVSIGHATILATVTLFSNDTIDSQTDFSFDNCYAYVPSLSELPAESAVYALLELDHPTVVALNSKVLGSKLDTDVHTTTCRLAFEGRMLLPMTNPSYKNEELSKLRVFKLKEKCGVIERANNDLSLIHI